MNNYKVSGKKLTSRFEFSHKAVREMVKSGIIMGDKDYKEMVSMYGRDPSDPRTAKMVRMSKRLFKKLYPNYLD